MQVALPSPSPSSVQIGPFSYKIEWTGAFSESSSDYCAIAKHNEQKIVLEASRSYDQCASSLLHEILHCIFRLVRSHDGDTFHEEEVVEFLSSLFLDMMRRNPDVISWLMKGEDQRG